MSRCSVCDLVPIFLRKKVEMIVNKEDEENSGDEEQEEGWVSKNVFIV